eukprot:5817949-Alexandrium_andersonii.AAC.1
MDVPARVCCPAHSAVVECAVLDTSLLGVCRPAHYFGVSERAVASRQPPPAPRRPGVTPPGSVRNCTLP